MNQGRLKQDVNLPGHMPYACLKESSPLSMLPFPSVTPAMISHPGCSAEAFSVSGTPIPSFPHAPLRQAFPARRVVRRSLLQHPSLAELEEWASKLGLEPVLGPLITTAAQRLRVLQLLWQYKHLNREDLRDLPCTDLITHRVRIAPGTKPASSKFQKRWPAHTEWWLRKLVQDGLEGGVYELTEPANGRLSLWNARAVMVDKVEDPKPTDEPRMTFDYSRVTELLPGTHMELSSKVHDHLANPRHGCLFSADLKHAYLTIPLHPDDRHYFAFTISGIGQIQPTRMQQGSQSAGFTMTELAYRAFGPIPTPYPEPSLLHSSDPAVPPPLTFYMDDFFGGFRDFEDLFSFLRDHFFPRVEWAKLLLSFKKLRLFATSIKALGVVHKIGGHVHILEERIAKVAKWPVPSDQSEVRGFLGTVGITRRWVKNFAEVARPLSRLTGKVAWKWTQAEQLSFEILRIKCATRTSMHGIDLNQTVHLYTDASGFAAGCAITQFQPASQVDVMVLQEASRPESSATQAKAPAMRKASASKAKVSDPCQKPVATAARDVEVPVLYDSFTFSPTQRKYPTYKRELCAIITFCKKYDYLCKHPYKPAIVHTDHKPLTYFLGSDLHEGIYGNWADSLRRLNLSIQYIPGHRNKVADGLSRTIFDDPECSHDSKTMRIQEELTSQGPKWVWKDGAGGFDAFLRSLEQPKREEVLEHGTVDGLPVFCLDVVPRDKTWKGAYAASTWFGEIYKLLHDEYPTVSPSPILIREAFDYRIVSDILWKHRREYYLPCIPESKVLAVLTEAHDQSGHWAKAGTMARLKGRCYWPEQSRDVERYIAGCIDCARHGPATRSQLLNPVLVTYPFQLIGMDFIGPLKTTRAGCIYILNVVCYFSRFVVPFACRSANVEDVLWCLRLLFVMYRTPFAIYCDSGQHFDNEELREFLRQQGISINYSPSGSSKSTGMVEVSNKLLEEVLRKDSTGRDWDEVLPKSAKSLNTRVISYLSMSPTGIIFGPVQNVSPVSSTLLALPGRDIRTWHDELMDPLSHTNQVHTYLKHRSELHDLVTETTRRRKEQEAFRYNKGVTETLHHLGDLVMLYQKHTGKLEPRWRGPFRIFDYGGSHGKSFTLQQLNGREIRGSFHGDHLKKFVPRCGYLADPTLPSLPQQQPIRRPRKKPRASTSML